jgi:Lon protease-like protein
VHVDPSGLDLSSVPLFPLPGVVLFPRAVLPLHIFENRYRKMTADALVGPRLIAMALLKPGWEKSYYGRPAIEPVVCVGRILTHEKLPDGKYNFLLQGLAPARVIREYDDDEPYRVAELEALLATPASEVELQSQRRRLNDLFVSTPLGGIGAGPQFRQLVTSPLPTPDVAHVAAFTFLENVPLKQSLLEETDTDLRINRTIAALEELAASLPPQPVAFAIGSVDPRLN